MCTNRRLFLSTWTPLCQLAPSRQRAAPQDLQSPFLHHGNHLHPSSSHVMHGSLVPGTECFLMTKAPRPFIRLPSSPRGRKRAGAESWHCHTSYWDSITILLSRHTEELRVLCHWKMTVHNPEWKRWTADLTLECRLVHRSLNNTVEQCFYLLQQVRRKPDKKRKK